MTYAQPMADPTNVVGRRIGAYLIDGVIVFVVAVAIMVPLLLSKLETAPAGSIDCTTDSGQTFDGDRTFDSSDGKVNFCFEDGDEVRYLPQHDENRVGATFYALFFGAGALDLVLLQGLAGGSLGKLMVGLRVVRDDGSKAGIGWNFLRWVLLFVDSFCLFLPGAILVFTTKGHRRIGDMAASTYVVGKGAVGSPIQVSGTPPAYQPAWGGGPGGAPGASGGWAGPPAPGLAGTWSPPGGAVPAPTAAAPSGDGPSWDAARNAYIQYDHDSAQWVQWSDTAREWRPIDQ